MRCIQTIIWWSVPNVRQALRLLALGSTVLLSSQCVAAPIELNSGIFRGNLSGEGHGRGLGLRADSTVNLTSIGIHVDLNVLSFDAQIYASTNGSDTGALLASESTVLGGTGFGWQDILINFTLDAGSFYVLHFRPTIPNINNWVGAGGIDYYEDFGLPVTVGPFTLIDGEEGYTSPLNFSNALHPSLRVNVSDPPIEIALDIKPGPSNNTVPLNGNGTLQVAILANEEFNVMDVNIGSLLFGDPILVDGGATPLGATSDRLRDLNHDGLDDLLVGFSISDLVAGGALDASSVEGRLTGELFDGTPIFGSDIVRMVPQNNGGGALVSSAVPEPSTLALTALGLLGIGRRRRKRS